MKKITIIATHRTGSSRITSHFPSVANKQYNTNEIYSGYIPPLADDIKFILENPPIATSWIDFIVNITNKFHEQVKYHHLNLTYKMLGDLQSVAEKIGYHYFITKILNPHIVCLDISTETLVKDSDFIIMNYRRNMLETFISGELALYTKVYAGNPENKQQYDAANYKIAWDKNKYDNFIHNSLIKGYDKWLPFVKNNNVCVLQYEKLAKIQNLTNLLNHIFNRWGIEDMIISPSRHLKLNDQPMHTYIQNANEFLQDIKKLSNEEIYYTKFDTEVFEW